MFAFDVWDKLWFLIRQFLIYLYCFDLSGDDASEKHTDLFYFHKVTNKQTDMCQKELN